MAHHYRCGEAQRLELASLDYPHWLQECSSAAERVTVRFEPLQSLVTCPAGCGEAKSASSLRSLLPTAWKMFCCIWNVWWFKTVGHGCEAEVELVIYYSPADWLKELSFSSVFSTNVNCSMITFEETWLSSPIFNARWNYFALFIQYWIF